MQFTLIIAILSVTQSTQSDLLDFTDKNSVYIIVFYCLLISYNEKYYNVSSLHQVSLIYVDLKSYLFHKFNHYVKGLL